MSATEPTPVQAAVLLACVEHNKSSFAAITPASCWWRARSPFAGDEAAFARHLLNLTNGGWLRRWPGQKAQYSLTLKAQRWLEVNHVH